MADENELCQVLWLQEALPGQCRLVRSQGYRQGKLGDENDKVAQRYASDQTRAQEKLHLAPMAATLQ